MQKNRGITSTVFRIFIYYFPITIQRHQHLQMCVSILSCVNTHDKPAADTYAHSHGYNSLRSLYHVLRHMIILRLIPMRIRADIIHLRSLYHVLRHMISLRLIPMRIRADIIHLRSLYHVLRHMISLRLIPMRIRADIIRLRSLYLMFQNCILIQCYDCMCIFQRKSMYLISVLRFLHNILSLMFLH